MLRKIFSIILVVTLLAGGLYAGSVPVSAAINLTNPGFENGLTGWTIVSGTAQVRTGSLGPISPHSGSSFAYLTSTASTSQLKQAFSASSGDTLSGWALMSTPTAGYFDYARIEIFNASGTLIATPFKSLDYNKAVGSTGWLQWTYTFQSDYTNCYVQASVNGAGTNTVFALDSLETNTPVLAFAGGPYHVNEGGLITLHGSASNAGSSAVYSWSAPAVGYSATGMNPTFSAAALNGNHTIDLTLTVTDGDKTASATTLIYVKNVAPIISFTRTENVDRVTNPDSYYVHSGSVGDAGSAPLTVHIDYADPGAVYNPEDPQNQANETTLTITPGAGFHLSHKYPAPGLYNIKISADDGYGGVDNKILQAKIGIDNNTAPYFTAPDITEFTAAVGDVVTIDFASYDIDADLITLSADTGSLSGITFTHGLTNGYATLTWATAGAALGDYQITVVAADSFGLATDAIIDITIEAAQISGTISVNHPPTAEAGGPYIYPVGVNIDFNASASTDPDGDELTFTWDLNNDGLFDEGYGGAHLVLYPEQLASLGITPDNNDNVVYLKVSDPRGASSIDYTYIRLIEGPVYTILSSTNGRGRIIPQGDSYVAEGESLTLNMIPDEGYYLSTLLVDGETVPGAPLSYTFENVTADHTIEALFAANSYPMTLTSSNPDAPAGEEITFTVALEPSLGAEAAPDGSVIFTIGDYLESEPVALGAEINGIRYASFVVSSLPVGVYAVVAEYTPDTTGIPAGTAVSQQTVIATDSNLTVSYTPETPVIGQPVSFTAVISADDVPTGSVAFLVDGLPYGDELTLVDGTAVLPIIFTTAGEHTVTVSYSGDDAHSEQIAEVTVQVLDIPVVTLSADSDSYLYGSPVTLVATVTVNAGAVALDGAVALMNGTEVLDSRTLSGGQAVFVLDDMATGAYTVYAVFNNNVYPGSYASLPVDFSVIESETDFVISVEQTEGGTISPAGDIMVSAGANQTFAIDPEPGYYIAALLVDGISVEPSDSYTFVDVQASHTLAAEFALEEYSLTVTATTGGSVSGYNPGEVYYYGDSITLTASAEDGYEFEAWLDADNNTLSQEAVLTLTFTGDTTVVASFIEVEETGNLTVVKVGEGDINPEAGVYDKEPGQFIWLTADADPGWKFAGWESDSSSLRIYNAGFFSWFIMPDYPVTITATFTSNKKYQLDVTYNAAQGTVTVAPDSNNGKYPAGTVVTLTAAANQGYEFDSWQGVDSSEANVAQVTLNSNRSVTALFKTGTQASGMSITKMFIKWDNSANNYKWYSWPWYKPGNQNQFEAWGRLTLPSNINLSNLKSQAEITLTIPVPGSNGNSVAQTITFNKVQSTGYGEYWLYNDNPGYVSDGLDITFMKIWWSPNYGSSKGQAGFHIQGLFDMPDDSIDKNSKPTSATLGINIAARSGSSFNTQGSVDFRVNGNKNVWSFNAWNLKQFDYDVWDGWNNWSAWNKWDGSDWDGCY